VPSLSENVLAVWTCEYTRPKYITGSYNQNQVRPIQLLWERGLPSSPRGHLPAVKHSSMLRAAKVLISKMLRRESPESGWSGRCCAAVVLVSVCLLTIRVATRFSFAGVSPTQSVRTANLVQVHLTPERSRQRLIKDATTWKNPLVYSAAWQIPVLYGCIVPAGPSLPGLLILENLYNRPPPHSANFFVSSTQLG
jgi:hypothetical protein